LKVAGTIPNLTELPAAGHLIIQPEDVAREPKQDHFICTGARTQKENNYMFK